MTDDIKKIEEAHQPEEPPKPPTVPLFQIPDAILNSMGKEANAGLDKFSEPLDFIKAQRKLAEAQVQPVKESPAMPPAIMPTVPVSQIPKKREKVPVVSFGGADVSEETLVTLFYLVLQEASKNKEIKKKLKSMKIEVYDANGDLLWP
jgi:hypothetical protein